MYLFFRLTCEQKQHQFCSFDYLKKAINQRFFQITGVMSKKKRYVFWFSIRKSSTSYQPQVNGGEFDFSNVKRTLKFMQFICKTAGPNVLIEATLLVYLFFLLSFPFNIGRLIHPTIKNIFNFIKCQARITYISLKCKREKILTGRQLNSKMY